MLKYSTSLFLLSLSSFAFCDSQVSHGNKSPNIKTTGANSKVIVHYNGVPLVVTQHPDNKTPFYSNLNDLNKFNTLGNGTPIKVYDEYKKSIFGELVKVKIITSPLKKYNGITGWTYTKFIAQVFE